MLPDIPKATGSVGWHTCTSHGNSDASRHGLAPRAGERKDRSVVIPVKLIPLT